MPPQTQTTTASLPLEAPLALAPNEVQVDDKVYEANELAQVHPGELPTGDG